MSLLRRPARSVSMTAACVGLAALLGAGSADAQPVGGASLRVCADPNNMPFSNEKGEGFENKLAEL
ncbi:MAG: quinoprotein dehydrogenase-associated putative ABC transporter substrate-binding protein, partial [Methyloceanibacter sp.]|nr:quinoprotein dehydrogenase-associated putative ABC transporter substrate-binding protein [Methyloceanibacter sp.]